MKKIFSEIIPILIVGGIGLWSVKPAVINLATVADYGKDGWLITWIINQSRQNLSGLASGRFQLIFDGNIFYPYKHVLAYSDMFFMTAFMNLGPWLLTHRYEIAMGWTMITGQLLTGLIVYLWWRKITDNKWAAVIGTAALELSQVRWMYQVHMQMWTMQYWLAGSWLLCSWWNDKKRWKLFLGSAMLGLQVWESLLPVWFAGAVVGMYILSNSKLQITDYKAILKEIAVAGGMFGLIAIGPLWAYRSVSREFSYQRSIREAAHNGMSVDDMWGVFGSPGLYVLMMIAIIKLALNIKHNNYKQINKNIAWLAATALMGGMMALGPTLKWEGKTVKIGGRVPVPLPYAAAYYLAPGFGAFRTPSRWMWLFAWAGSGLIAIGLIKTDIKKAGWWGAMAVAIAGGVSLAKYTTIPGAAGLPAVYRWLETQPGQVIAELPMGEEVLETDRMVYSIAAKKEILGGWSGFFPPERMRLAEELNKDFPNDRTINELKNIGVNYVVIDKKRYKIDDQKFKYVEVGYDDPEYQVVILEN